MKRNTIICAVNSMFEKLLASTKCSEERKRLKRAQLKFTQDTLAIFGEHGAVDEPEHGA